MKRYFTHQDAKKYFQGILSGKMLLEAGLESFSETRHRYDIFISHSYNDKEDVRLLYNMFKSLGLNPYIDWIDDRLDSFEERKPGDPETAKTLKDRMQQSSCMLYVASSNADHSLWMPWEFGYCDGIKKSIAIFPFLPNRSSRFDDCGYLKMYPKVEFDESTIEFTIGDKEISTWIRG